VVELKTIGCDPEVLFTRVGDGMYSSVEGKIPGSKTEPFRTSPITHILVDNVAGEFNVAPATNAKEFSNNVYQSYLDLVEYAYGAGLVPSLSSVGVYSTDDLKTDLAMMAGCDADWCVYNDRLNPIPPYDKTRVRCAGGHIHLGLDLVGIDMQLLVQALDLFVSIPMLKYDNPLRRKLYGKAGSIRIKDYGIEYRTPSNLWIFEEAARLWVVEAVRMALDVYLRVNFDEFNLQHIIDHHDLKQAEQICSHFNLTFEGAPDEQAAFVGYY